MQGVQARNLPISRGALGWRDIINEALDHPRAEVLNAIKRRGYPVYYKRGLSLRWASDDAPALELQQRSYTPRSDR